MSAGEFFITKFYEMLGRGNGLKEILDTLRDLLAGKMNVGSFNLKDYRLK